MRSKFFPLNPGRHVSISTNRVQWKWHCVTSGWVTLSKLPAGNPLPCLKSQKAPWRTCSQGTATFRATATPATTSPRLNGNLCFWIQAMTFLWLKTIINTIYTLSSSNIWTLSNNLLKSCKKQSKFQAEVFASSNCFRYTTGKTNSHFQRKKKLKYSVIIPDGPGLHDIPAKRHTSQWGTLKRQVKLS